MIKRAKYMTSVADPVAYPDFRVPEIAIAGKSNAGKSSFINMLTGQKKLAFTSAEPGRTRLINYFEISNGESDYFFVDLPGYGYAKVSEADKLRWGELIESYFKNSARLINVFVLVDIRRKPSEDDLLLIKYLYAYSIPFTVIATKADKISRMQQGKSKQVIASAIGIGADDVLVTSAKSGLGKDAIYARIDQLLAAAQNMQK